MPMCELVQSGWGFQMFVGLGGIVCLPDPSWCWPAVQWYRMQVPLRPVSSCVWAADQVLPAPPSLQAQFALDQARKGYASSPALAALLPREERLSSAGLRGFRLGSPSQCVYVDHTGRQHNVAPQVVCFKSGLAAGGRGCHSSRRRRRSSSSPVLLHIVGDVTRLECRLLLQDLDACYLDPLALPQHDLLAELNQQVWHSM